MKFEDFHFHPELIAGDDAAPETHLIETGEHEETARTRARFAKSEDRARLRERLDDEDSRHHRVLREMAGEERLVVGDVLVGDNAAFFELQNPFDEKEGVANGRRPKHS